MQHLYPFILFLLLFRLNYSVVKFSLAYIYIYQVDKIFSENAFDAVIHFAAVAYVGESTAEPLRRVSFSSSARFFLMIAI